MQKKFELFTLHMNNGETIKVEREMKKKHEIGLNGKEIEYFDDLQGVLESVECYAAEDDVNYYLANFNLAHSHEKFYCFWRSVLYITTDGVELRDVDE